jgi:hypothetical protein
VIVGVLSPFHAQDERYGREQASAAPREPTLITFYRKLTSDRQLQDMDEAGIDVAVLNLAQWSLKGVEMCRLIRSIAGVVKNTPTGS